MFDLLYFSMWTDSGAGPARRLGKLKWSVDESCYDELVLADIGQGSRQKQSGHKRTYRRACVSLQRVHSQP